MENMNEFIYSYLHSISIFYCLDLEDEELFLMIKEMINNEW